MNRRIREKRAVQAALRAKTYWPSDCHMPETRVQKKIRLALKRQVERGERVVVMVGDFHE